MNKRTTIILLLCIVLVFFQGFKEPRNNTIRFKQLTSTIKNDTNATIHVIIDNGEREREFTAFCTVWPDSFSIRIEIPDWYRNFSKTYTATIPIK